MKLTLTATGYRSHIFPITVVARSWVTAPRQTSFHLKFPLKKPAITELAKDGASGGEGGRISHTTHTGREILGK